MPTNKTSLLLIGNAGSIHIYNYIKNVVSSLQWEVTILSTAPESEVKADYKQYYSTLGIKLVYLQKLSGNHLGYIINALKTLSNLGRFDYLHVQYVSYLLAPAIFFNKKQYGAIALSFWGSDLYRDTNSLLKRVLVSRMVRIAKSISFITEEMYAYYKQKYKTPQRINYHILDFGNLFFDEISIKKEEINKNDYEAYSSIGLSPCKPIVTIGYSGRKEMQQYESINAIINSDIDIKRIQLAVPAYGIAEDNYKRIVHLLDSYKCKYKIYNYFMDVKQTSSLRAVTNIFLHTQTTDALSSAMLEHLYGGSVVINGEWLNYETLDKAGVFYLKVKDFNDLGTVLKSVLDDLPEYEQKAQKNNDLINTMCSWEHWRSKWLALYDK